MSTDMPQQASPIIIKGGSKSGIIAKAIEIWASGDFQITQHFQSQPNDWIQSDSDFSVSYIESVVVGEMGNKQQFCQTSLMAHPLTFEFEGSDGNNIFTVSEVAAAKGYSLQISVDLVDDYFQITNSSSVSSGNAWTVSTFNTTDPEVYAVEVTDANGVPVCRLLRANEEDIYLNLEPS